MNVKKDKESTFDIYLKSLDFENKLLKNKLDMKDEDIRELELTVL